MLALAIVYGVEGTNGDEQPPQWVSMVYNSLARFGFSLSVGWVTFACVTGNGGKNIIYRFIYLFSRTESEI